MGLPAAWVNAHIGQACMFVHANVHAPKISQSTVSNVGKLWVDRLPLQVSHMYPFGSSACITCESAVLPHTLRNRFQCDLRMTTHGADDGALCVRLQL